MDKKKVTTAELVDVAIQIIVSRIKNEENRYEQHVSDIVAEAGSNLSTIMNGDSIKRHAEEMGHCSESIMRNRQFLNMLKEIRDSIETE